MTDTRTRREKLEAMANQTVSPNEAAVAKHILAEMGDRDDAKTWEQIVYDIWKDYNGYEWEETSEFRDLFGQPIARHSFMSYNSRFMAASGQCVRCHLSRRNIVHMTDEEEADFVPIPEV